MVLHHYMKIIVLSISVTDLISIISWFGCPFCSVGSRIWFSSLLPIVCWNIQLISPLHFPFPQLYFTHCLYRPLFLVDSLSCSSLCLHGSKKQVIFIFVICFLYFFIWQNLLAFFFNVWWIPSLPGSSIFPLA